MNAGLNGNFHRDAVFDPAGALAELGVTYLGDGEWSLPHGGTIEAVSESDWLLTIGSVIYHVWTED